MEHLHNGFTLSPGPFPLSTDSLLLADFVRLPRAARVLDLGSGGGALGLLLCARAADCTVTGVELDPEAHRIALENIARNGLGPRLSSICADLRHIPEFLEPERFDCCVSNPPYFPRDSRAVAPARREDPCPMEALFASAAWGLRFGGDFFLVHRPERLAEIFSQATRARLEPKRLRLVRHRPGSPVNLVLVQCRKGAKPGLIWEELCLLDAQGQPTGDYRRIYHQ